MKTPLAACIPCLLLPLGLPLSAEEPTLARLAFWVPPAHSAAFEVAYENQILPILKEHGLVPSSVSGRVTPDSVFARLFEIETPSAVALHDERLKRDTVWTSVLAKLGSSAAPAGKEGGPIRHEFMLYSTPAGPGTTVTAGPGYRQGPWHTLGVQDGLGSSIASSILQDREGHLWFGTSGGLSRFNGRSITTFTTADGLSHNWVYGIFQDNTGVLWFSTRIGVTRYDGTSFTVFTAADGLANNFAWGRVLQDLNGHFWLSAYRGGVSRYDGQRFETFPFDVTSRSTLEDRQGNLWFGTHAGVSRWDGQQFRTFTTEDGLASFVISLLEDRDGSLWFGHGTGVVTRYDGHQFTNLTTDDGLAHDRVPSTMRTDLFPKFAVMDLEEDEAGNVWMATGGGAVTRYDGQSFTNFTTNDGFPSSWAMSILQDREGFLWFASNGGVSRFDAETFKNFTTLEGLAHNWVGSIIMDRDGTLWIGTEGGLNRYDGETLTTFTTEDGLAHNDIESVLQDRDGLLWIQQRMV